VINDQSADLHDLTASIINFAVNRYIKIKKNGKNFELIKLKNPIGLLDYEQQLWQKIFPGQKTSVKISELKNKFYAHLPNLKKSLYQEVTQKGYYATNPDRSRKIYLSLAFLLMLLLGGLSIFLMKVADSGWYLTSALVVIIQGFILAGKMPKRSKKGALAFEEIQGFKMYLTHAERYRIERLYAPKNFKEIFEKYIPYAIVLKVEREWAQQFKHLYNTPPNWYEGENYSAFTTLALISSLHNFNSITERTLTSTPAPKSSYGGSSHGGWSGGSGFSGGFSGGGFGGGGGGSW